MNLFEILFEVLKNSNSENVIKEIDNITTALETHIKMYENATDEDDMVMATIVLNQCVNGCINITKSGFNNVDNNRLEKLLSYIVKAKGIINCVLEDTIKTINNTIEIHAREVMAKYSKCNKPKEEDIDYSKYTKAELIELLRNKQ